MHLILIAVAVWFAVSPVAGILIGKAIKGPGKGDAR